MRVCMHAEVKRPGLDAGRFVRASVHMRLVLLRRSRNSFSRNVCHHLIP